VPVFMSCAVQIREDRKQTTAPDLSIDMESLSLEESI
jgi:hypothetical protein